MAITQINPVARPQEQESDLDKIMKGLAIANEILKVPTALEGLKKTKLEQQDAIRRASGQYNLEERDKLGFIPEPETNKSKAELMAADPKQLGIGAVLGQQAAMADSGLSAIANNKRFGNLPVSKIGDQSFVKREDFKDQESQVGKIRDDYNKTPEVAVAAQAAQNYGNIQDASKHTGPESDVKMMMNYMRMINPGVQRAPDGSIVGDLGGFGDEVKKWFNRTKGDANTKLLPEERARILQFSKESMQNAITRLQPVNDQFSALASRGGFQAEDAGVRDFASEFGLGAAPTETPTAPSKQMVAKAPQTKGRGVSLAGIGGVRPAQPQTVTQNGHTYKLNPTTGKYE